MRFTEAVPAKTFGKMSLTGIMFTEVVEADFEVVPAKTFGKMPLTSIMFTEVVEADFE